MSNPTFLTGSAGTLAVHDFGGQGDRVLLICHATGFHSQVYRAFADELVDDVRVVGVDMRGHGDSEAPRDPADFDWRLMADDLKVAIEHLEARELHGFGHSKGGAVLLEVERTLPGTFRSAMVFEPIVPPGKFPGETPIATAARGRLRAFPTRGHALERYASRPPLGLLRADVLHDYVHHGFRELADGTVTLKCTPESEANTFLMAGSIPLTSLSEIQLDVAVARSGDEGLAAGLVEAIVDQLPNGELLEFNTLTHFGPLQEPVVVANEMTRIIRASSS